MSVPFEGALSVFQDLIVERFGAGEVVALSDTPSRSDEEMTLDLISSGPPQSLQVRVIESSPVIVDGSVRFRLRLGIIG